MRRARRQQIRSKRARVSDFTYEVHLPSIGDNAEVWLADGPDSTVGRLRAEGRIA